MLHAAHHYQRAHVTEKVSEYWVVKNTIRGVFSQVLSQVYALYLTGNYIFQWAMSSSWQWLEELHVLNAMLSMLPQEVKK
jgi:hypothetical protein